MNFMDTLFGGGEQQAAKYQAKGAQALREGLQQSKQYQQPYYNAGTSALQSYQNALQPASNPSQFYEDIMRGYNISPAAERRMNLGLNTLQGRASATGGLGSGQLRQDMMDYIQSLLGEDAHQYLQDILGIRSDYMGGQNTLMGYGQNAGTQLSGIEQGIGSANQQYYGARANQATAKAQGIDKMLATLLNTGANYATGGISGVVAPYTSNYYKEWRNPDYQTQQYGGRNY